MHSHSGTHLDALCHSWYDNQLYNGYRATDHVTSWGATRNAIDNLPALVGRGVVLDVAGLSTFTRECTSCFRQSCATYLRQCCTTLILAVNLAPYPSSEA